MIYLAEIQARDVTTNLLVTFRYSSGLGFTDDSGNFYEPRIEQPGLMRREMSDKGFAGGINETYGELTLVNADGGLDFLYNRYIFAGQSLVIKVGEPSDSYAQFTTILKVTLSHPSFEKDIISFRIRDYASTFDKPFLSNAYAGSNVGPSGLEGDASLKDTKKPRCLGRPLNIAPILVNSSLSIYQVSDGGVDAIVRVRDKGVDLRREADYASLAAMTSTSPSPGCYRVYAQGGYFRVGTPPFGTVTACVIQHNSLQLNTVANLIKSIVLQEGGLTVSQINSQDFIDLDALNASNIGYYVTGEESIRDVLDNIAISIGAWWGFDNLGIFRIGRFDDGAIVYTDGSNAVPLSVNNYNIVDYSTTALTFDGKSCPLYKLSLNHSKNWTVQTPDDLAGAVSLEQSNWLELEYRKSSIEIAGYVDLYPMASEASIDTLLCGKEAADFEVARVFRYFRSYSTDATLLRNKLFTISVMIDSDAFFSIELGSKIEVNLDRFEFENFTGYGVVIGFDTDYQRNQMNLTLYMM
jgi:hypothetical protein